MMISVTLAQLNRLLEVLEKDCNSEGDKALADYLSSVKIAQSVIQPSRSVNLDEIPF